MRMFRLIDLFRHEAAPARESRTSSPAEFDAREPLLLTGFDEREPLLLTDFVEPPQPAAPAAR